MHIVQLLPELNQGGVERGVVELSRELVLRGHQSTVISCGGRLVPQLEREGTEHVQLDVCRKNPFTAVRRAAALRAELVRLGPDIVHVRSRVPAWLTRLANWRLRLPVVSTVHGYNSVSCYSRIMTYGDRVICVSNGMKAFVQENYGTAESKLRVIYRGVDLDAFVRPDDGEIEFLRCTHRLNRPFVLVAGRISPLKGIETVIEAVAGTRFDLVVVGSAGQAHGEYLAGLQQLVADRSLRDRVHFVGTQEKLPLWYAAAEALVTCSRKPESFGRTLVEALAVGTPVIAARQGGPLEIVDERVNGFLFEPNDAADLACALEKLGELPATDRRGYVAERFSLTRMVDGIVGVYAELTP